LDKEEEMMSPKDRSSQMVVLLATLAFFPLLTLSAKDFWEEKPFTQWNQKEALQILSDSPWGKSQMVTFPTNEAGPGEETGALAGVPAPAGAGNARGTGVDSRSTSASSSTPAGYEGEARGLTRAISYQVTWYSSLRVRQALGRLGQLQGKVSEEQVNSFAQQPMENHIIAVSGSMMKPFEEASLETLKSRTFLLSKKDKKKKLELKEYMSPKERKDGMALFVFPRTVEGKPTLDVADDEVTFTTEQGTLRIKGSFKLSRMITDGKLDI
jgi:hypothetical protein